MWQRQVLEKEEICFKKNKLESTMNPMFLAEVVGNGFCGRDGK